jgi:DNA-binding MarR family transcriptional regulator
MAEHGQLSVNDRVLLHLSRFASDTPPEEHPKECSQAGIAHSVGISRTHVPRAVKALVREGLVEELRARVSGHERRMSVYAVTAEGVRTASALWEDLSDIRFVMKSPGKAETVTIKRLEEMVGRKQAIALVARSRAGVIEAVDRQTPKVRDLVDAPPAAGFFGRNEELEAMAAFMDSDSDLLVVRGNRGYGASALTRRFVDSLDDCNVLWISLSRGAGPRELGERMLGFARRFSPDAPQPFDALGVADALIVFDGYHSVPEETVEFFASIVVGAGEAKVIVTAGEDVPAYSWFYHKDELVSGKVREMKLRGLDVDSAKSLLGNPAIDSDAFKRIMMMTRGSPRILSLLRDRDFDGLKKNTVFTTQEIRYLLFLIEKTA